MKEIIRKAIEQVFRDGCNHGANHYGCAKDRIDLSVNKCIEIIDKNSYNEYCKSELIKDKKHYERIVELTAIVLTNLYSQKEFEKILKLVDVEYRKLKTSSNINYKNK